MRLLFWAAATFISYTYFGYLGWLWLRVHLHSKPVLRAPIEPHISIVMVVRNEENVLNKKLQNLLELDYPRELCQIVVASDGSTDRTDEILRDYADDSRVQIVIRQPQAGKAERLNDALALTSGEVIVFTDARQKIEPGAVRSLLESFADPEVGCVSGELMLGDPDTGEIACGMGLYWRIEKQIRELEAAIGSVVGATGALYAVRRDLIAPVPPGTLLDDVYVPLEIARQGKRVMFEPRARAWDVADQGIKREFWRKVRTLSGNYQLLQLSPWLLTSRNPLRFEFISHKLMRLFAPIALIAALISCALLPGAFYRVALVLQVVFYALAVLATAGFRLGPLTRVSDAAQTFVLLNAAALVALANFVRGRKSAWLG